MIRYLRLIVLVSLVTSTAAGLGGLIGLPLGRRTTLLGATALGTLGVLLALTLAARIGWFDPERRRGGSIGGLVGLAVGAPLALPALGDPLVVAGASLLVGIGVIAGAGLRSVR